MEKTKRIKAWTRRNRREIVAASLLSFSFAAVFCAGNIWKKKGINSSPIQITTQFVNEDKIPDRVITSDEGLMQIQYGVSPLIPGPVRYLTRNQILREHSDSLHYMADAALKKKYSDLEQATRKLSGYELEKRVREINFEFNQFCKEQKIEFEKLKERYNPKEGFNR